VNVQISASTSSADGTNATLSFKEFVVLPRKQPVCVLDPSFVTRLGASLLTAVGTDPALGSEEPQSPVLPTPTALPCLGSTHRVSLQLTLQKKTLAFDVSGLKPAQELQDAYPLSREPAMVQDQSLVTALEEPEERFPEGLHVQPAGVRDPEVKDGSLRGDVLLESETVALALRALVRLHVSSVPHVEVSFQLRGKM